MEQLDGLLKAADLTLDDETLDRIDEIVPPGTDIYHADGAWQSHRPHPHRPPPPPRRPLSRLAGHFERISVRLARSPLVYRGEKAPLRRGYPFVLSAGGWVICRLGGRSR